MDRRSSLHRIFVRVKLIWVWSDLKFENLDFGGKIVVLLIPQKDVLSKIASVQLRA